jgi:methanogenic corrinoid protein MtbC1
MLDKLLDAMVNMKEKEAIETARTLLDQGENPLSILNTCTRAMETVGERFERGEYFLPHLIMAGEMLKQISQMVKPQLQEQVVEEKLGKVVIGTVEGDIHDIGKDIVTFIFEVNGLEVHDIGIDVAPGRFVEAINQFHPQVVGMSGLLTLAYDSMKNTVEAIEDAGLRNRVKIMIGGGQMSDDVKAYVGADAYCKDAIEGLNLAKKWTGNLA